MNTDVKQLPLTAVALKRQIRLNSHLIALLSLCFFQCQTLLASNSDAQAVHSPGTNASLPKVVLIGDSIMGLYCPAVQRDLDSAAEVNGFSRTTSRYVLDHLNEVISAQPDIIHLNCGLHDMIIMTNTAATQISLDEYKSNLEKIFQRLQQETHAQVIWATTTPVSEQRQQNPRPKGYGRIVRHEADIKTYNRASVAIAKHFGLKVNDLFEVMTRAGPDKYFRTDGVHFNSAGDELLGQAVAKAIRSSMSKPRSAIKSHP